MLGYLEAAGISIVGLAIIAILTFATIFIAIDKFEKSRYYLLIVGLLVVMVLVIDITAADHVGQYAFLKLK